MQEIHSVFIPAEFKLATNATNRQSRRVLLSSVRNTEATPACKNTLCPDRGSPYRRESSAVRPADSSGSCSGIRVSITNEPRENIILPPRPGRCQCVVSHCVRTSPAAQRSQPSLFDLKPASIVIQMSVALEPRTRACPPSSAPTARTSLTATQGTAATVPFPPPPLCSPPAH